MHRNTLRLGDCQSHNMVQIEAATRDEVSVGQKQPKRTASTCWSTDGTDSRLPLRWVGTVHNTFMVARLSVIKDAL